MILANLFEKQMAEILHGMSVALFLKVLGAGLSFLFSVYLARSLGAEGTGIYFLALSLATVGTTIGRFGLDNTMLRFVAEFSSEEKWAEVKGVHSKGMKLAAVIATAVVFVLFLSSNLLAYKVFNKPDLEIPLKWMSLSVLPLTFVFLYGEILKGLKLIRDSQLVNGVIVQLVAILLYYLVGKNFEVIGAVLSYAFACVFSAMCGFLLWLKNTPNLESSEEIFDSKLLVRTCWPFFLVTTMNMIVMWSSNLFLGAWGTKADLGIYGAAVRISMLVNFILVSVNSIAAPNIAAAYGRRNLAELRSIVSKSSKVLFYAGLPLIVIILLGSGYLMSVFGEDFSKGKLILQILIIGQSFTLFFGPCGCLLSMTGYEKVLSNNSIVVGIVTIVLCLLLVPRYGIVGASLASTVSAVFLGISLSFYVKRIFKISIIRLIFSR